MPTQNRAQIDKFLTNISNKYKPEGMIHDQIFPVIPVNQFSGKIGSYGKSNFRIEVSIAGGKNKIPYITSNVIGTDTFVIETHGLGDLITEEDRSNFETPFNNIESDRTEDVTDKLMLGKEKALADQLRSTSVITQNTTLSGSNQYSHSSGGSPIANFKTARNAVRAAVGALPNLALMGYNVFDVLRYNPVLVDLIKYSQPVIDGLSEMQLASALGVEKVLVGKALYDQAKEGQATSLVDVWGNDLVFAKVTSRPQVKGLTLGGIFQKGTPREVFKNPVNNPPRATEVLVQDRYDMVILDDTCGYLIKDAVA